MIDALNRLVGAVSGCDLDDLGALAEALDRAAVGAVNARLADVFRAVGAVVSGEVARRLDADMGDDRDIVIIDRDAPDDC